MKSIIDYVALVFCAMVLFFCFSFIAALFVGMINWLFSFTKCSNCTKMISGEAIRCPRCGSFLTIQAEVPNSYEELNAELYDRVKVFAAEFWPISKEKLTPDTRLADDLGIAGDDGYELLEAFCEEFEIQNTSEIDPTEYFGSEGWDFEIFLFFYYLIFERKKLNDYYSPPPLTLRDLVKSVEAKRWIPPQAI